MKSYLKFLSRNKLYTTIEAVGQRWGKEKRKTASEILQMRFLSDSYRQLLSVRLNHNRLLLLTDMIAASHNVRNLMKNQRNRRL